MQYTACITVRGCASLQGTMNGSMSYSVATMRHKARTRISIDLWHGSPLLTLECGICRLVTPTAAAASGMLSSFCWV